MIIEAQKFNLEEQIEKVIEIVKYKTDLKNIDLRYEIDKNLNNLHLISDAMRLK